MIYVRVEKRIPRRPEVVWGFLTDVASLPTWVEGLVEAERVASTEPGVGMQIEVARRVGGKRSDATVEVTAWHVNHGVALETRLKDLLLLDRVVLEGGPDGTTLTVESEIFYGNRFVELFARPRGLLGGSMEDPPIQKIYERSLEAFAKLVIAQSAAPYR